MRIIRLPQCLLGLILMGYLLSPVLAAPVFPKLTGQVVDNANMLSASAEARIRNLLEAHMNATGNQIAVATVPDLQGYDIATFGYQLGRHWQLGQKEKDNGVLLLIARQERQFRIDVGYGLEGELTDAISANIIHTVIRPEFKRGNFDAGVEAGVQAIIQALGGQYQMRETRSRSSKANWISLIIFLLIVFGSMMGGGGGLTGRRSYRRGGGIGGYYGGGLGGGGFGGGGGGFSGGGGSFGGGGASGGW